MKTIEVNLIGELGRTSKASRIEIKKETVDTKTRVLVVALLIAVLVVFSISFGAWFFAQHFSTKYKVELNNLKEDHEKLLEEKNKLSAFKKELERQLKIAKLKKLAREQVNDLYIPWSEVLKDITFKIPKDIVVFNVEKSGSRGKNQSNASVKLKISGVIPAYKDQRFSKSKMKPLTAISFLILNINEDKNSLLSDAKINSIDYDSMLDIYEFEIETRVKRDSEREAENNLEFKKKLRKQLDKGTAKEIKAEINKEFSSVKNS